MEPLMVLILVPVLTGVTAEWIFRDTRKASLAAALACPAAIFLILRLLDPDGALSWLATLLVTPLAIALSLATVLLRRGRAKAQRLNKGRHRV